MELTPHAWMLLVAEGWKPRDPGMSGSGSGATLIEPIALSKGAAMKVEKKVRKIVEKAEKKIAKLRPDSKKDKKKA